MNQDHTSKKQCHKCGRPILEYLQKQNSSKCFVCITEQVPLRKIVASFTQSGLTDSRPGVCRICKGEIRQNDKSIASAYGQVCIHCYTHLSKIQGQNINNLSRDITNLYLIKSAHIVKGPYTKNETFEQIKTRELNGLDEILSTEHFWCYIRDHSEFSEFLRNVNTSSSFAEDTVDVTTTIANSLLTKTEEVSVDITNHDLDEDSIVKEDIIDISESQDIEPVSRVERVSQFTYSDSRAIGKQKKKNYMNNMLLVSLLAIVIIFVYDFYSQRFLEETESEASIFDYRMDKQEALKLYSLGKYSEAKEKLSKLYSFDMSDFEVAIPYAYLLIKEQELLQAKAIFQEVKRISISSLVKSQAENGLGFIAYLNNENQEAENFFREAIRLQPDYEPAQMNLVELLIFNDQVSLAAEALPVTANVESIEPTRLLFHTLIAIKQLGLEEDNAGIVELRRQLLDSVYQIYDYRQEIIFLISLMDYKLSNFQKAQNTVFEALNMSPNTSDKHIHNLHIHFDSVKWKTIYTLYKTIEKAAPEDAYLNLAFSYISHRKGDVLEAKEYLKKVKLQIPSDLTVKAIEAYMEPNLQGQLRLSEALEGANGGVGSNLYFEMVANNCFQKRDFGCSKKAWNMLITNNPSSLEAYTGKAEIAINQGLLAEAQNMVLRALGWSPRYIPMLEMEQYLWQQAQTGGSGEN